MLWAVYLAAIPLVTIWAMLSGWRSGRPELTRCGAVVLGHAAIVQLYMVIDPPIAGQGYPFIFLTLALVGALWLICRIPAGKQNALLAGGVLFGILSTLVYGVSVTLEGSGVHADWAYFSAQFTMGWANLLVLIGWTHERSLSRIVDYCFRAVAGLVRFAHLGGVAR
jgi:hypothetical protein